MKNYRPSTSTNLTGSPEAGTAEFVGPAVIKPYSLILPALLIFMIWIMLGASLYQVHVINLQRSVIRELVMNPLCPGVPKQKEEGYVNRIRI